MYLLLHKVAIATVWFTLVFSQNPDNVAVSLPQGFLQTTGASSWSTMVWSHDQKTPYNRIPESNPLPIDLNSIPGARADFCFLNGLSGYWAMGAVVNGDVPGTFKFHNFNDESRMIMVFVCSKFNDTNYPSFSNTLVEKRFEVTSQSFSEAPVTLDEPFICGLVGWKQTRPSAINTQSCFMQRSANNTYEFRRGDATVRCFYACYESVVFDTALLEVSSSAFSAPSSFSYSTSSPSFDLTTFNLRQFLTLYDICILGTATNKADNYPVVLETICVLGIDGGEWGYGTGTEFTLTECSYYCYRFIISTAAPSVAPSRSPSPAPSPLPTAEPSLLPTPRVTASSTTSVSPTRAPQRKPVVIPVAVTDSSSEEIDLLLYAFIAVSALLFFAVIIGVCILKNRRGRMDSNSKKSSRSLSRTSATRHYSNSSRSISRKASRAKFPSFSVESDSQYGNIALSYNGNNINANLYTPAPRPSTQYAPAATPLQYNSAEASVSTYGPGPSLSAGYLRKVGTAQYDVVLM